jgi:hypothetical protein
MTAIITSKFRISAAKFIKEKIKEDPYFMFLGRNQAWLNEDISSSQVDNTVVESTDDNIQVTHYDAYYNMQLIKKINSNQVELCALRSTWISGTQYRAWDPKHEDLNHNSFDSGLSDRVAVGRDIFLCLYAPVATVTHNQIDSTITSISPVQSTIAPTVQNAIEKVTKTSDGYIWKFLFTISDEMNSGFTTDSFIPVSDPSPESTEARDVNQRTVQNTAALGKVYTVSITKGGKYPGNEKPTVQVIGDGNLAQYADNIIPPSNIIMESWTDSDGDVWGYVKEIRLHDDSTTEDQLNGITTQPLIDAWQQASIKFTSDAPLNETAVATLVLPNEGGFGKSAQYDLNAHNLGINCKFDFDPLQFKTATTFREIGVITGVENQTVAAGESPLYSSNNPISTLKKLVLNDPTSSNNVAALFGSDVIIKMQTAAGMVFAHLDYVQGNNLYYHQDASTGFLDFKVSGSVVTESETNGQATAAAEVISVDSPDIKRFSGDIIYLEKRRRVFRADDQIENIKLIIEL